MTVVSRSSMHLSILMRYAKNPVATAHGIAVAGWDFKPTPLTASTL